MRDPALRLSPGAYFALFAISGFAGLMYESVWTHYLKLFLGHAAYAQTLVLVIFMGGMAIGAWLAGRYSARMASLLKGYAIVEGIIGASALAFHVIFVGTTAFVLDAILPGLSSSAAAHAIKWGVAALLILPQSVLLGMTFPLMSGAVMRRVPAMPGHTLASLYFSNSIGAVFGVLASGFVLIGLVGLPGTMLTAGLLNLLLALFVWLVARDAQARPAAAVVGADGGWSRDGWVKFLLLAAAVTGAASFLYEIAWIRMLTLVLGGSTHSFELMLAAFILGLALGGLYMRKRIDRIRQPVRYLGWVQLLMGGFALATLLIYGHAFEWMGFLMRGLARSDQGYDLFLVFSSTIALAVMLPATFMAGMTLPLMTFVLLQRGHGERTIGSVYAANTIGAIAGVLVAVHVLMTTVGLKGVLLAGVGLDVALGVALLAGAQPHVRRWELAGAALAACAALVLVTVFVRMDPLQLNSGVYRTGAARVGPGNHLLFHGDGKTATVALMGNARGVVRISTNGKPDASLTVTDADPTPDEATMIVAGTLALAHHPGAKLVANIGFGSGLTTDTLLSTSQLERVDTIEIEPFMVEAARGFGARVARAFEDPRSHIHIEDAKTFFSTRAATYDVIVSEPSNPWVSGVASLFSTEFYSRARRHLRPDGLLVQWIQGYEIDLSLLASVFRALGPHFDDYAVYTTNGADLLIVARAQGKLAPLDADVLRDPGLAKVLGRVHIAAVQDLEFRKLLGRSSFEALLAAYPAPANSDYFPYLDQHAARARFLDQTAARELTALHQQSLPVLEVLDNRPAPSARRPVTRDEFYVPADLAPDARPFGDEVLGRGPWSRVDSEFALDWSYAEAMLRRCENDADWGEFRRAVQRLAGRILPYLPPEDAAAVLERLRSSPCATRLPPGAAQWLDLLHAIAKRDATGMGQLAMVLAEQGGDEAQPYLVQAAMLSALARNQSGEVMMLWDKYRPVLMQAGAAPLQARLLVAVAYAQATRLSQAPGDSARAAERPSGMR